MKNFIRLLIIMILFSYYVIPNYFAPYQSPQDEYMIKDWALHAYGAIYTFGYLFLWFYLYKHSRNVNFNSDSIKKTWRWVILIGGIFFLIGPILYYIFVFELRKGVVSERDSSSV